MKAIASHRTLRLLCIAWATAVLASCSAPRVVPEPTPTPTPTPVPPPVAPPPANWQDAPLTPGDWSWGMEGGRSTARFGGNLLTMQCNLSARTVEIARRGTAPGPVPFTIVTDSTTRQFLAQPEGSAPGELTVKLPSGDRLLDAMAFTRGHFALETTGLQTLYVPSWPEISRVIEDCR